MTRNGVLTESTMVKPVISKRSQIKCFDWFFLKNKCTSFTWKYKQCMFLLHSNAKDFISNTNFPDECSGGKE